MAAPEPGSGLEWWRRPGTPDQDAAHVDPAWWVEIKTEQTARVQADRAARREAAARAVPVTDAEIALYGTGHGDPGTRLDEEIASAKDTLRHAHRSGLCAVTKSAPSSRVALRSWTVVPWGRRRC